MDLTGDGVVAGNDISRFLEYLNGMANPAPMTLADYLDINGDGHISGADINRAIQLIHGMLTHQSWSGFNMGPRPQ